MPDAVHVNPSLACAHPCRRCCCRIAHPTAARNRMNRGPRFGGRVRGAPRHAAAGHDGETTSEREFASQSLPARPSLANNVSRAARALPPAVVAGRERPAVWRHVVEFTCEPKRVRRASIARGSLTCGVCLRLFPQWRNKYLETLHIKGSRSAGPMGPGSGAGMGAGAGSGARTRFGGRAGRRGSTNSRPLPLPGRRPDASLEPSPAPSRHTPTRNAKCTLASRAGPQLRRGVGS